MSKERLLAITLIQAIVYTIVWIIDDYTGLIMSVSFSTIAFAILIISWIADRLEYADVGSWYYPLIIISVVVPLIIAAVFWYLKDGHMNWMNPIF
ncbi:MAG: hypothetical protein ABI844_19365 [Saprospiraceae bacterium]